MKTVAIIPAYNNAETVSSVIEGARRYVDNLIAVDDGSTDDTSKVLQKLAKRGHCSVLTHSKNLGKGEALKTAIKHLKSRSRSETPHAAIFLDADGEHNPDEIPRFLEALERADVVLGARTSHRSRERALLNRWMAFWFRLLDPDIADPSCGFRAVRWDVLKTLELRSSDFCIDAEMILEAIKAGVSITSVKWSSHTHLPSSVSGTDLIRINNFFNEWVLSNAKVVPIKGKRRIILLAGARVGNALVKLLHSILR